MGCGEVQEEDKFDKIQRVREEKQAERQDENPAELEARRRKIEEKYGVKMARKSSQIEKELDEKFPSRKKAREESPARDRSPHRRPGKSSKDDEWVNDKFDSTDIPERRGYSRSKEDRQPKKKNFEERTTDYDGKQMLPMIESSSMTKWANDLGSSARPVTPS